MLLRSAIIILDFLQRFIDYLPNGTSSLFGRISAVKTTILPKLMYIFETLPISIHRGELKPMQVTILHFIWAQKRHKISNIVLLASKSEGALAVQDILKYY